VLEGLGNIEFEELGGFDDDGDGNLDAQGLGVDDETFGEGIDYSEFSRLDTLASQNLPSFFTSSSSTSSNDFNIGSSDGGVSASYIGKSNDFIA
jgi:hypothetical protein